MEERKKQTKKKQTNITRKALLTLFTQPCMLNLHILPRRCLVRHPNIQKDLSYDRNYSHLDTLWIPYVQIPLYLNWQLADLLSFASSNMIQFPCKVTLPSRFCGQEINNLTPLILTYLLILTGLDFRYYELLNICTA